MPVCKRFKNDKKTVKNPATKLSFTILRVLNFTLFYGYFIFAILLVS